jgi:putative sigma-54 modulation protein
LFFYVPAGPFKPVAHVDVDALLRFDVCQFIGGAMQLNLSGHHVEVTPALKAYVEKKLDRIVRHSDHVLDVHCVLTVEKLRQKAEATVSLSGSKIHADATDENMYAAIDALADKLDRGVKKHKEKLTDHHAQEAIKAKLS